MDFNINNTNMGGKENKYLIFDPAVLSVGQSKSPQTEIQPLTEEIREKDLLHIESMFDGKTASFSPVEEKVEINKGKAEETVSSDRGVNTKKDLDISSSEVKQVIQSRDGKVLKEGTILKFDHYPTLHNTDLQKGKNPQPKLEGVPNFRRMGDDRITGMGQPTIEGIKNTLRQVGAGPGQEGKKAVWTTLREEPVVYINGNPLSLRENSKIFQNMENPGISEKEIENTENRLKKEILEEAKKNGGKILLHDETPDGKVVARWEEIKPDSVKTPGEVFDEIKKEGYNVDYARIPITDEKKPEEKDFDALTKRLKNVPEDAEMIFNCHAGRGRTTTGMVVAGLMKKAKEETRKGEKITKNRSVREDIRETADYKRGDYKVILSLIRTLEKGPQTKEEADSMIDKYSALQNLREAILEHKEKSENAPSPQKQESAQAKGKDFLDRYFYLIAYNQYLKEETPQGLKKTFSDWMKKNPQLHQMRENIQLAMGYSNTGIMGETAYA